MSNKIETVSIGDLPIATELDDADELLLRDSSAALPENATARLSIATLRAAMGSPDRIKSASGDAFSEATDSFRGLGTPASQSEAIARGAGASSGAYTLPKGADKAVAEAALFAGTAAMTNGASIKARYDSETGERRLVAEGAPLEVPTPTAPNHAATKAYVDARPGADAWSTHPATQDVDLDGHKITGLGEPTDAADAATKGYVDGAAPAKIERTFAWGRSVAEVADNGDIELAVYLTGQEVPRRRVRVPRGELGDITLENRNLGYLSSLKIEQGPSYGINYELSGGSSASMRCGFRSFNGRFHFWEAGGAQKYLSDATYPLLPAGVQSYAHAAHLAKQAHDRLPDLEWWAPVWTPVENVDSVSNVECQYTRTYRAAGGSLVTLEGTIEVTPEAAGQCAVQVDLPIARVGSDPTAGTAMAVGGTSPVVAAASVDSTALTLFFTADSASPYAVGFRASYRAS